jgi:hypothetical protein
MQLTLRGHSAHGRKGFSVHGDNNKLNHSASQGASSFPIEEFVSTLQRAACETCMCICD